MKENRKFISSTLLICLAAVFCVFQIPSASAAGSVAKKHSGESDKIYKAQDRYAAQSRKLAEEGKYTEAIRILQEKVINELELEAGEVDSWVARKRLAEYSTELRNMQLKFGNLKLEAAEKALEAVSNNDEEAARSALQSKLASWKNETDWRKKREKAFRFLANRGFPLDIIYQVLDEELDSHNTDFDF